MIVPAPPTGAVSRPCQTTSWGGSCTSGGSRSPCARPSSATCTRAPGSLRRCSAPRSNVARTSRAPILPAARSVIVSARRPVGCIRGPSTSAASSSDPSSGITTSSPSGASSSIFETGPRGHPLVGQIDPAGAGQRRPCGGGAQLLDRELVRSGLCRGQRQLHALAEQTGDRRGQQPRRRSERSVDTDAGGTVQGERDPCVGAGHAIGLQAKVAMPVLEWAVAVQVEREVAGVRAAREPGQQSAVLGGAEIERERTLRQIQARVESGPGGILVGAVQIERDIRRATGRAGPHATGHSEHCVLAEHRLADLEPVDADGTHDQRRDGPRQFGQRFAAGFLALRQTMQGEPTRAQLLDLQAPAQQRRRRGCNTKFVQLQPGTLGIGHAQLREPEIERDQTIQAGQADGRIGTAQGAA